MKTGLMHRISCLWRDQTILRILMNEELSRYSLRGHVVDVGGGREPNYWRYFKGNGVGIDRADAKFDNINFETDRLPYETGSVQTVICCNVLEHIYNYNFLVSEIHRILETGGQLIGFVPWHMGFHPDPHDYFRYTNEALEKILGNFRGVRTTRVGGSPILANFNTIMLVFPIPLRPLLYMCYAAVDALYLWLRPKSAMRNPLGYVFSATK